MPDDHEPVPRIPRGRGMKLDAGMLLRIAMTLALLIMIVVTARPCSEATSRFVTGFGDEGSAGSTMPRPGTVDDPGLSPGPAPVEHYEQIRPDMSPEEQRAAIERELRRGAAAKRGGSAAGPGSGATATPEVGGGAGATPDVGNATGPGSGSAARPAVGP